MKRLMSVLLALMLVAGGIPTVVYADSSVKVKAEIASADDEQFTMYGKVSYKICAKLKDNTYVVGKEVSQGDDTVYIIWSLEKSIKNLDDLKQYVGGTDIAKTSASMGTCVSLSYSEVVKDVVVSTVNVSELYFFNEDNSYIGAVKPSEVGGIGLNKAEMNAMRGTISTKVTPNKDESASVTMTYDFTKRVNEEIERFSIKDKNSGIEVLNPDFSEVYLKEGYAKKGVTVPYDINENGTYTISIETTTDNYTVDFTVNNIATASAEKASSTKSTAPKVTFSKLPKKQEGGTPLKVVMYTDRKCKMTFNGESVKNYKTKSTFTITGNGSYTYTAESKQGGTKTGVLKVSCFSKPTAKEINMRSYFGDGKKSTSTATTLPQTGKSGTGIVVCGAISIILGVSILFRKKIKQIVGGVIHVKK